MIKKLLSFLSHSDNSRQHPIFSSLQPQSVLVFSPVDAAAISLVGLFLKYENEYVVLQARQRRISMHVSAGVWTVIDDPIAKVEVQDWIQQSPEQWTVNEFRAMVKANKEMIDKMTSDLHQTSTVGFSIGGAKSR